MGGEDDTDMDDFVVHGRHDNPDDYEGEEAESPLFSTNAGKVALKLVCRAVQITGRVLLNLRGSLLLRKNRDLRGSRAERGFLERIVSMFSSKTVPLVYPEAMMMLSDFWEALGDGSVVGAMPSCLWNRPDVLSSNNFASAFDHMWTGLKNYQSQCCSDRLLTTNC